ncbi:MAG: OmpA family protein [Georgfuchsia sp.]
MKKFSKIFIAISMLGCSAYAIPSLASDFAGPYIGAGIGVGSDRASGDVSTGNEHALAGGVEAGYNWDINNNNDGLRFGLDAFYDQTKSKSRYDSMGTSVDFGDKAYGIDSKLGYVMGNNLMPYVKFGYGRVKGTNDADGYSAKGLRLGLGAEWKFADHWSLGEEVIRMNGREKDGTKLTNVSLLFSLKYYFADKPPVVVAQTAATPVYTPPPPPAPIVVKAEPPAPRFEHVTLSATELFAFDSAELGQSQPKLDEIATGLNNDQSIDDVVITGYTDRLGSKKYNDKLSLRRAEAVKAYLADKGVATSRMTAEGKGEANPVVECHQKKRSALIECLEPNRRVEVEQITIKRRIN